jgi:peptide/nickel transport system permease protein
MTADGAKHPGEHSGRSSSSALRTALRHTRKIFFRNVLVATGTIVIAVFVVAAILAPELTPYDPLRSNIRARLQAPSALHLLGTDGFGRDVITRIIYGARISLSIAAIVVVLTTIASSILGLLTVWFRSLDNVIMRTMDVFMSIPSLILAIALMGFLGADVRNLIIAVTLTQTPRMTRVARSAFLTVRELDYVSAAQALGSSSIRIMLRHIYPNGMAPIVVQATFLFAHVILVESGLSFLGIGTPPPTPSWGLMLAEGREHMRTAWWLTVVPGLSIMSIVIALNLLGDGLRDLLDPRLRGS